MKVFGRVIRLKWLLCLLIVFVFIYLLIATNITRGKKLLAVWFWIDIPGHFPWRYCLQEYHGFLAPLVCETDESQMFLIESVKSIDEGSSFEWKTLEGGYIVPGTTIHEDIIKDTLVINETSVGFWIWEANGQLRWSEGCRKCVTSMKFNQPIGIELCKDKDYEDQNIEIGRYEGGSSNLTLRPIDTDSWQTRQNKMREETLRINKEDVIKALAEIDEDDFLNQDKIIEEKRRAAVFYVDKGESSMSSVRWWIYTWRFIGLDAAEEGFDLVMMVHPKAVRDLPEECREIQSEFSPSYGQPGECLYKPYIGIAYRDKSYDGYMNSQECLVGPGSEFLSKYKLLMRVDLDTLPTPRLLGFWPDGVLADRAYGTNFGLDSIMDALKKLACSVGIEHHGWFNIGSSWYGNGRRVRNLSKLTVALNKYGRGYLFGPGTHCRCAECVNLPRDCEWGSGLYAGVLLLYLQEIAINK